MSFLQSFLYSNTWIFPLKPQEYYNLSIVNSEGLLCELKDGKNISCQESLCTTDYQPVCAMKLDFEQLCDSEDCNRASYKTYSNQCEASVDNALLAMENECEELEGKRVSLLKTVYMTQIELIDINSDEFEIFYGEEESASNRT